jgi:hypothetical protein
MNKLSISKGIQFHAGDAISGLVLLETSRVQPFDRLGTVVRHCAPNIGQI